MIKERYRLIGVWVFLSLLQSCSDFKEIEVGSPSAIIVKGIKDNKINVDLSLPIHNPNDLQFKITKVNLSVVINDNYLGEITSGKNVVVRAKSNEEHLFNLDMEVKSLTRGIITMINVFSSGRVEVVTNGYIKVRSGLVVKSIPMESNTTVKVRNKIPFLNNR